MANVRAAEPAVTGMMALVTGGASGIGAACARWLAAHGARVIVADLDLAMASQVADELGNGSVACRCDVATAEGAADAVSAALELGFGLQIAVNCAGIAPASTAPIGEHDIDMWRTVIGINLDGVFYCMRAQLKAMAAAGGGSVVNIASVFGVVGIAGAAAYVASKHAVVGLTRVGALEYAPSGVRVNAVGPGYINTPMIGSQSAEVSARIASRHPLGRLGLANEVAEVVGFLASPSASFVTGAYYLVDGGYTAQ